MLKYVFLILLKWYPYGSIDTNNQGTGVVGSTTVRVPTDDH